MIYTAPADQEQRQGPRALDFLQLGRFVLLSVMTAPPNYQWQLLLERWFPAYARPSTVSSNSKDGRDIEKGGARQVEDAGGSSKLNIRNTLTKWFVDCMTVGALVNTVAFLVLMGVMKGHGMGQIGQNLRTVSALLHESTCGGNNRGNDESSLLIPCCRRPSLSSWLGTRYGRLRRS